MRDQGGLCAYTGIAIQPTHCHIEHLKAQDHCVKGEEDVAYSNMVACYPGTRDPYVPFGAKFKDKWPEPVEQHLFVSPRSAGCESRFVFSLGGKVNTANAGDVAAQATITKLGLDNRGLEAMRKEAIIATIEPLDIAAARKRLAGLEHAESSDGPLEQFCFVLKQVLKKHISRLEGIRESKRK
jgi:uncharacterized protein (TIGR02646 family)